MRIAFWNTYNKVCNSILTKLVIEKSIDVLILAEYSCPIEELIASLEKENLVYKQYFTAGCEKIMMIGKLYSSVEPAFMNNHYASQIIKEKLLLCGLHLPSRLHNDGDFDRRLIIINKMKEDIKRIRGKNNLDDVIIVGDFNENPYEKSILSFIGLNSVPISDVAKKGSKTISGEEVEYYYNPMWNYMGDNEYPPGTYYYPSDTYWNMFDQVIISSSLIDRFCRKELEIITEICGIKLNNKKGIPNKEELSDHFPIVFEIKED